MPILHRTSTPELLKECCASRAPVTIIGDEDVHWGSFLHFDVNLTLELLPGGDPDFATSSIRAVCFGQPPGSSVLLATVKHYDEHQGHLLLTSLSPITRLERRRSRRIPVPVNCGLVVRLGREEQQWTPTPVDLSLSGLCVEFARDELAQPAVGSFVDVKLSLGDRALELQAQVVRQKKRSYGLCFLHPISQPLQQICELLERATAR